MRRRLVHQHEKCEYMKSELLFSHTGKPVENGKGYKGAIQRRQACLASTFSYEPKSKPPKLIKLIELDQNTNRGHPLNNIQICPVT